MSVLSTSALLGAYKSGHAEIVHEVLMDLPIRKCW